MTLCQSVSFLGNMLGHVDRILSPNMETFYHKLYRPFLGVVFDGESNGDTFRSPILRLCIDLDQNAFLVPQHKSSGPVRVNRFTNFGQFRVEYSTGRYDPYTILHSSFLELYSYKKYP